MRPSPSGLAVDPVGNVYVADSNSHAIYKVAPDNTETLLAGGTSGFADGTGATARFNRPGSLALDASGNVFVGDYQNSAIRKITPAGVVSAVVPPGAAPSPRSIAMDPSGTLYFVDGNSSTIRRLAPNGALTTVAGSGAGTVTDGIGTAASFRDPSSIAIDGAGTIYVSDYGRVRQIDASGIVTDFSGSSGEEVVFGYYGSSRDLAVDPGGNVYVTNYYLNRVTKLVPSTTTTIAGMSASSNLIAPAGVAVNSSLTLYVADQGANAILKITAGVVSAFAGGGGSGFADGVSSQAQFNAPGNVCLDAAGNVYVADTGNHRIRKVAASGTVSTLAGTGMSGFADGAGNTAQFSAPEGIAIDSAGNVFVGDTGNHRIRKISPAGAVSTVAGTGVADFLDGAIAVARFASPRGVAVDATGKIYVADTVNQRIRVISSGTVSTLAGSGASGWKDAVGATAQFNTPKGLTIDAAGVLYVSDTGNRRIRRIDSSGAVTTLAGSGLAGSADGVAASAAFASPLGLAVDGAGAIYVADALNQSVRQISSVTLTVPVPNLSSVTASLTVGVPFQTTVTGSGGPPPVLTVQTGSLPPGLAMYDSGIIAGTPTAPGNFAGTLAVSNAVGTGTVTFTLNVQNAVVPPVFLNAPIAVTVTADGYTAQVPLLNQLLAASGIPAPTFSVQSGSLPTGPTLSNDGLLKGTVRGNGTYTGLFAATNAAGTVTQPFSFTILQPPASSGSLKILATALSPFTINFSNQLHSGYPSPTFTLVSGALPPGLTMDSAGNITGTPPNLLKWMTYSGTVRATNVAGSADVPFTIDLQPVYASPTFAQSSVTFNVFTGAAVAAVLNAPGYPAANYRVDSGRLPPGVTLDYYGNLLGAPVAPGVYTGVFVADNGVGKAYQSFTFAVTNPPAVPAFISAPLTTTTLLTVGVPALAGLQAGGYPAPTFSLQSGALPAGLALTSSGSITGTPTLAGTYRGVFAATNASGTATQSFTLTILSSQPPLTWTVSTAAVGAPFVSPVDVAVNASGVVFVTDSDTFGSGAGASKVFSVSGAGQVSAFAGSTQGYVDALGTAAKFNDPVGITVDPTGTFYVVDRGSSAIRKITSGGQVSTLAGGTAGGANDGTGSAAKFLSPQGVAIDAAGANLYVADFTNNRVRKVTTAAGIVTTIVGNGSTTNTDGVGTSAVIVGPTGIAADGAGNVYVSQVQYGRIRLIAPDGTVSTFAGPTANSGTLNGYVDGSSSQARFTGPWGLGVSPDGTYLYVADSGNNVIRSINRLTGQVKTLAVTGTAGRVDGPAPSAQFNRPAGLTVDGVGNIWVVDNGGNALRKLTPSIAPGPTFTTTATAFNVAPGVTVSTTLAGFGNPAPTFTVQSGALPPGLTLSVGGQLSGSSSTPGTYTGVFAATNTFGTVTQPFTISITQAPSFPTSPLDTAIATGATTVITGSPGFPAATYAVISGSLPAGLTVNQSGTITGTATTAGVSTGVLQASNVAGTVTLPFAIAVTAAPVITSPAFSRSNASANWRLGLYFNQSVVASGYPSATFTLQSGALPPGLTLDASGAINGTPSVAGEFSGVILVANSSGSVTQPFDFFIYAVAPPAASYQVSTISSALGAIDHPVALAVGDDGSIYYSFHGAQIGKRATDGTGTLFAGGATPGYLDGVGVAAQFQNITALALDGSGNLYAADKGNPAVRVVTPGGVVSSLPAFAPQTASVQGLAVDRVGNVTLATASTGIVSRLSAGAISVLAGGTSFAAPGGLALDLAGNVYVAETNGNRILKISGATVTTFAGSGAAGFADGTGTAATFRGPQSVAVDSNGTVYVADTGNHAVRMISSDGIVTTLAGNGTAGSADGSGLAAQFNAPSTVAVDAVGQVYVADTGNGSIRRIAQSAVSSPVFTNAAINGSFAAGASFNTTLAAGGGSAAPTFTVQSGALPPGITLTPAGVVSGTFTTAGVYTGQFAATSGAATATQAFAITVTQAPAITSAPIGSTVPQGSALNTTLTATGVPAPAFRVDSGALPPGLTLSSAGVLAGTPTASGTYSGFFAATNSSGSTTQTFSLTVTSAAGFTSSAVTSTSSAANLVVGAPVSVVLTSAGFPAPSFTVTSGNLPPGLVLVTSGAVTGTPTSPGIYTGVFSAANSINTTTQPFTFIVYGTAPSGLPAPVFATPPVVLTASAGATVTATLVAGGNPAPSFTLASGTLPPGLTLSTSGALSGTPTAGGIFTGTIAATNSNGTVTQPFTVTINSAPNFSPQLLSLNFAVGVPLSGRAITAAGLPAATYAVTTGAMPAGVVLNSDGTLTGTPTTRGSNGAIVTATNAEGSGTVQLAFTVADLAPISTGIAARTYTVGQAIPADNFGFDPSGATTFSLASGTLPPGLALTTNGAFSGTPTTTGNFTFVVAAANAYGTATQSFTLTVGSVPVFAADDVDVTLTVGVPFSQKVGASGFPAATVTLVVSPGLALPAGLSLAVDGTISGTPTAPGYFTPYLMAQNSSGFTIKAVKITVRQPPSADDTVSTLGTSVASAQLLSMVVAPDGALIFGTEAGILKVPPGGSFGFGYFAGGITGYADGNGFSAQFDRVAGLALDANGNLYAADQNNHRIRKITPAGVVTTIAGSGVAGYADGRTAAQFNSPTGIALDAAGNLYVADSGNRRVRKIATTGIVSTLAGEGVASITFSYPTGVAVDPAGNIWVTDPYLKGVAMIGANYQSAAVVAAGGFAIIDGPASTARINQATGITIDGNGNAFVTCFHAVRRITPSGFVTTVAGSQNAGDADGPAPQASFDVPVAIAVDPAGNLYVVDSIRRLRKITRNLTAKPAFTSAPVNTSVVTGTGPTASLTVAGSAPSNFAVLSGFLPPGVTLSSTGQLAGAATTSGTYFGVLTASNERGLAEQPFTIFVTDPISPPTITTQPTDVTVLQWGAATFQVSATGSGTLTYQWQKNGTNISGATNASFSIANATSLNAGTYSVQVRGTSGTVTSNAVQLTVQAPAFADFVAHYFTTTEQADSTVFGPSADPDGDGRSNLLEYALGSNPRSADLATGSIAWENGSLVFRYTRPAGGLPGVTYTIESSSDLATWTPVTSTLESTTNGSDTVKGVLLTGAQSGQQAFGRLTVTQSTSQAPAAPTLAPVAFASSKTVPNEVRASATGTGGGLVAGGSGISTSDTTPSIAVGSSPGLLSGAVAAGSAASSARTSEASGTPSVADSLPAAPVALEPSFVPRAAALIATTEPRAESIATGADSPLPPKAATVGATHVYVLGSGTDSFTGDGNSVLALEGLRSLLGCTIKIGSGAKQPLAQVLHGHDLDVGALGGAGTIAFPDGGTVTFSQVSVLHLGAILLSPGDATPYVWSPPAPAGGGTVVATVLTGLPNGVYLRGKGLQPPLLGADGKYFQLIDRDAVAGGYLDLVTPQWIRGDVDLTLLTVAAGNNSYVPVAPTDVAGFMALSGQTGNGAYRATPQVCHFTAQPPSPYLAVAAGGLQVDPDRVRTFAVLNATKTDYKYVWYYSFKSIPLDIVLAPALRTSATITIGGLPGDLMLINSAGKRFSGDGVSFNVAPSDLPGLRVAPTQATYDHWWQTWDQGRAFDLSVTVRNVVNGVTQTYSARTHVNLAPVYEADNHDRVAVVPGRRADYRVQRFGNSLVVTERANPANTFAFGMTRSGVQEILFKDAFVATVDYTKKLNIADKVKAIKDAIHTQVEADSTAAQSGFAATADHVWPLTPEGKVQEEQDRLSRTLLSVENMPPDVAIDKGVELKVGVWTITMSDISGDSLNLDLSTGEDPSTCDLVIVSSTKTQGEWSKVLPLLGKVRTVGFASASQSETAGYDLTYQLDSSGLRLESKSFYKLSYTAIAGQVTNFGGAFRLTTTASATFEVNYVSSYGFHATSTGYGYGVEITNQVSAHADALVHIDAGFFPGTSSGATGQVGVTEGVSIKGSSNIDYGDGKYGMKADAGELVGTQASASGTVSASLGGVGGTGGAGVSSGATGFDAGAELGYEDGKVTFGGSGELGLDVVGVKINWKITIDINAVANAQALVQRNVLSAADAVKGGLITGADAVKAGFLTTGDAIKSGLMTATQAVNSGLITASDAVASGLMSSAEAVFNFGGDVLHTLFPWW